MTSDQMEWGKSDHLTYLEIRGEAFNEKDATKLSKIELVCADCGHPVTTVSQRIEIWGSHDYTFGNLGYPVRLGCFLEAPGCIGVEQISHGYSWFKGYAWQIQLCQNCYFQLGWKYISPDSSFFGLIFGALKEQGPSTDSLIKKTL
ncbi:cereblon family protein [Desulfobacula sp.]|uniref:cereblon family protein n=1 Tax=Desulfobacula sp. TaxID=2593537 RepID=UPI0026287334|nr:cereblon family protein [Desulfobacula sp.]